MLKKILVATLLCFAAGAVHAVPVTVGAETDAYSDTENGWLIFEGVFDAATDLTTDTVAIEGLQVTGATSFVTLGLATFSSLSTTVDLAAGIYTLFLFDSFGDGMTCEDLFCFFGSYAGGFTLDVGGTEIFNNIGDGGYGQLFVEFEVTAPPPTVAEPPMLALLGFGLIGMGLAARRRG